MPTAPTQAPAASSEPWQWWLAVWDSSLCRVYLPPASKAWRLAWSIGRAFWNFAGYLEWLSLKHWDLCRIFAWFINGSTCQDLEWCPNSFSRRFIVSVNPTCLYFQFIDVHHSDNNPHPLAPTPKKGKEKWKINYQKGPQTQKVLKRKIKYMIMWSRCPMKSNPLCAGVTNKHNNVQ